MKQILIVITCLFFGACGGNLNKNETADLVDSVDLRIDTFSDIVIGDMPSEYENYYIVVADTAKDYHKLRFFMFVLEENILCEIDTMNRYYDAEKDLICLPENDEDEMDRGHYFPRRSPSPTLSLEYINFYKPGAGEKTIALVAGIYESENEANARLADVKKVIKSAFLIKSEVFVGCMH